MLKDKTRRAFVMVMDESTAGLGLCILFIEFVKALVEISWKIRREQMLRQYQQTT